MAHEMTATAPSLMSFNVRPIEDGVPNGRWHWTVYDDPQGRFVRDGQVTGDRDKAERAAEAAILIMGGRLADGEGVG